MTPSNKTHRTTQDWEEGLLGESEEHAELASEEIHRDVEETLAMQMISIRLPKTVIDDFKALAALEGMGYQPLMREALIRFARGEAKRLLHELAAEKRRQQNKDAA